MQPGGHVRFLVGICRRALDGDRPACLHQADAANASLNAKIEYIKCATHVAFNTFDQAECDYTVLFGAAAVSSSVTTMPPSGMLEVNMSTKISRVARRGDPNAPHAGHSGYSDDESEDIYAPSSKKKPKPYECAWLCTKRAIEVVSTEGKYVEDLGTLT